MTTCAAPRRASSTVAARVRRSIAARRPGVPFAVKELLHLGNRAAIDQEVHRLVAKGVLARVARGIYSRPRRNRVTGRPMVGTPDGVAAALARSCGHPVVPTGAEATRRLGLSTQMPQQAVRWTSGPSRVIAVGANHLKVQHVPARYLLGAGTRAGEALTALLYLGREEVTPEVVATIRSRIGEAEFARLRRFASAQPKWFAQALGA